METAVIGAGLIGLVVGILVGRWSVRGTQRRLVWPAPARGRPTRSTPVPIWPPDEEIEALVRAGRKIQAIKRHRDLFESTLRQARDAVDAIETRLLGGG